MYLVLVWRPEVAGSAQEQSPFGGISLAFVSLSQDDCELYSSAMSEIHPNWQFCVMPVTREIDNGDALLAILERHLSQ